MKMSYLCSKITYGATLSICLALLAGCNDDDDSSSAQPPTVVEDFGEIALSVQNEIPAIEGREETGTATMVLYSDNTLQYTLQVNNLLSSDQLSIAHIHEGNAAQNGSVVITLVDNDQITFDGNTLTNTITLTEEEIAAISEGDFYVNIHSQDYPAGLVRGQLRSTVALAADITLSPQNEIPLISDRPDSGVAVLRMLDDNTLYYTLNVGNVATSDQLTIAHIHDGNAAVNGPVLITLVDNDAIVFEDNSVNNSVALTEEEAARLQAALEGTDGLYVNIHSTEYPAGLMRGQLEGDIIFRADVEMSTANEVPPIAGRSETGTAVLRLLENNILFYHLQVNDLSAEDQLTVAHIHEGAAGENGSVIIGLVDNDQITFSDSVASGQTELDDALAGTLQNNAVYVNVHSAQHGSGLLRGQVTN